MAQGRCLPASRDAFLEEAACELVRRAFLAGGQ